MQAGLINPVVINSASTFLLGLQALIHYIVCPVRCWADWQTAEQRLSLPMFAGQEGNKDNNNNATKKTFVSLREKQGSQRVAGQIHLTLTWTKIALMLLALSSNAWEFLKMDPGGCLDNGDLTSISTILYVKWKMFQGSVNTTVLGSIWGLMIPLS